MHTTNYYNGFVAVAPDCPETQGTIPPEGKKGPSIAQLQFEMVKNSPYTYTSDDVIFQVFALRKDLIESEWSAAREEFFSKGQPCFRASPLTKRYGWGVHSDAEGRIALYGMESKEYEAFQQDASVQVVLAMRNQREK